MSSSGGGVVHTFTWDASAARGIVASNPGGSGSAGRLAQPLLAGTLLLSDGTNSFIYGPDGLPIEQIDNAGNAVFLDEDAQGSVRLLTGAAGNVLGTASYDAFGNQTAQTGESSPFGYDGMYRDAESGLYAMSCSVYDPATGQNLAQAKNCTASCKINVCGDDRWVKIAGSTPGAVTYKGVWMVGAPRSGEGCGNGLRTEFALLSKREQCDDGNSYDDLRVGDGIDESCQGKDLLCTSSPYGAGGGDPVNAMVSRNILKQFFVRGAGS
jgi:RHS repeat-associated protein